jgi:hypothetical protein
VRPTRERRSQCTHVRVGMSDGLASIEFELDRAGTGRAERSRLVRRTLERVHAGGTLDPSAAERDPRHLTGMWELRAKSRRAAVPIGSEAVEQPRADERPVAPSAIDAGKLREAVALDRDAARVRIAAEGATSKLSHVESEQFDRRNRAARLRLNQEAAVGMLRASEVATFQDRRPSDEVNLLEKRIKEAIHRRDEAIGIGLVLNLRVSVHLAG